MRTGLVSCGSAEKFLQVLENMENIIQGFLSIPENKYFL